MSREGKRLERIFKGVANHRRIDILFLLKKHPNLSLMGISQSLNCNLKTIAEHTRRLALAGLIDKSRLDNQTLHRLSPYGEKILEFVKDLK